MAEPDERVLALWSPDWPVTAAMQAAHVPAHRPAAVFLANRVVACSAGARAAGVRRGLRRRDAQARCPELAVLAPDADRDARLFEPVVVAVEELAPGVEVVRPGLLALPARGPVGFFGGEREAAERLIDQVAACTGVECQTGFADGLFAAVLAARRGVGVEPGRSAEFLAPLGVEELDREPDADRSELVDLLRRLGLRSLGAFGALAQADVASRFGADAVLAHRLARGLDPRPPVRRRPPEELAVAIELDPPVTRVDAAAFAARALAERLHRTLAGHGLSCTRLGVWARTEGGEELLRVWRCAEPLTPAGTVDRVRWQLDAWLTRGGSGAVVELRLTPEETVTAGALQLGLWGDVGEADERAGRALVRVQALLGPESVVTAVLAGGRDPDERVRYVPWGDDREPGSRAAGPLEGPPAEPPVEGFGPYPDGPSAGLRVVGGEPVAVLDPVLEPGPLPRETPRGFAPDAPEAALRGTAPTATQGPAARRPGRSRPIRTGRAARDPVPAWPGRLPAPSPATVPEEPIPVELHTAEGRPVGLHEADLLDAEPDRLLLAGHPPREVREWAGPWPVRRRWWSTDGLTGSRLQVELADGVALLLLHREERWWVTGIYD
ncbi:DNA polymerase Y family protein [Pseudonocardia sp. RS11V-5]|uniref:Y-family DNA polymerase n=1 Tax=Pseudonocardia terrae TaxID=2905831 RepID=UPI001E658070|nr:DNA polymerase Y family protein [Pseudonocardia terrae]MCE3554288.1 DNA polymerase Y family protein [Pseudonocardia terrae]